MISPSFVGNGTLPIYKKWLYAIKMANQEAAKAPCNKVTNYEVTDEGGSLQFPDLLRKITSNLSQPRKLLHRIALELFDGGLNICRSLQES